MKEYNEIKQSFKYDKIRNQEKPSTISLLALQEQLLKCGKRINMCVCLSLRMSQMVQDN